MEFFLSWRGSSAGWLIAFGGLFVLIAIALEIAFAGRFSQIQSYQTGRCIITAKQLFQEEVTHTESYTTNGQSHTRTTTTTEYRPDFRFTVLTANDHSYAAQGYDAFNSSTSDQSGQQAIVDQYTVGKTYPCWYDPAHPTQAVLTRQFDWFIFLVPGIFLLVGLVIVVVGIAVILNTRSKRRM
jgi:hypothetical protein